jgi:glycosyltransferase involved in cell wall biosynthesis
MVKDVSIVIPTKNSGAILEKCLASIESQDYPKDGYEVIIVDGHSTDNTVEIAGRYGCTAVYEEIGTIGGARNVGVAYSKGDYIIFTDADCVAARDWLSNLIKEFNDETIASVGGPNITPEGDTNFARGVGIALAFLSSPGPRYGVNSRHVREIYHNPTCNSAYNRRMFEAVGGFNSRLITCDDEELDYRIRERGYTILYTPDARVFHYRRPTWKSFMEMAYRYGIGRMQAIKLHWQMGRWYHFTPSAIIAVIAVLLVLSFTDFMYFWGAVTLLIGGGIGIGLMSLYLGAKTKLSDFVTFFGLIAIWFWGYGAGMLRGLTK